MNTETFCQHEEQKTLQCCDHSFELARFLSTAVPLQLLSLN